MYGKMKVKAPVSKSNGSPFEVEHNHSQVVSQNSIFAVLSASLGTKVPKIRRVSLPRNHPQEKVDAWQHGSLTDCRRDHSYLVILPIRMLL